MSGHVGDLSPSQEQALKEFRRNLSDVLKPKHDDYLLLQFLRARRFDLKKTEEMFRRHLRFREEFPEEYFLNEYQPHEILVNHLLPPLIGYDKEGCPVRIIHIGHQDIRGILASVRRPEIRKCITWFLDTDKNEMRKRSQETGVYVETRTFIFDLEGLSLRQIYHREVYELMISFLRLYEGNYPENLRVAFVINTPPFFSWLFSMVRSILSDDTVKKLRIHGYSGWKEDLLNHIDADLLPVIYGGTRTDPDGNPRCPSLIREFFMIPKECYLRNQNRLSLEDPGVVKVMVGRRSKYSVPIRVDYPGSTIEWEIDCKNCDISAYLIYSEGSMTVTLAECKAISSSYGAEKGCHLVDKAGQYMLVLDNSYSILRSKAVLYRVDVVEFIPPDEDILHSIKEECLRSS